MGGYSLRTPGADAVAIDVTQGRRRQRIGWASSVSARSRRMRAISFGANLKRAALSHPIYGEFHSIAPRLRS